MTPDRMPDLVFLDTETTGLDPSRHEVWEIAYAFEDGEVDCGGVTHDLLTADAAALDLNGYWTRTSWPSKRFEMQAKAALTGRIIVGANPAFDASFLRARWRDAPWHYRMIDIESYAMPALGLDRPKGLAYIAEQLGVTAPDHSARQDVLTLRACYLSLRAAYVRVPR